MTNKGAHGGPRSGSVMSLLSLPAVARLLSAVLGNTARNAKEAIARFEATRVRIADAITAKGVTVNPTDTFEIDYATRIGEITTSSAGWNPPDDWGWDAAAAQVDDGDNAFVGIYACFHDIPNHAAFKATFSGTATVDWGDGSAPEAVTSGVGISHEFNYAGITAAVSANGFKSATVIFQATGDFSIVNFDEKHASDRANSTAHWICLKIRSNYTGATPFQLQQFNSRLTNLRLIDFGTSLEVRLYLTFYTMRSLSKLIYNFGNNTTTVAAAYVFFTCGLSDYDWNSDDWSNFTVLDYMWQQALGGSNYYLDIAIDSCTSLYSTFRQSDIFSSVKFTNSGSVTNLSYTIYNSNSILYFEMDDASGVTNTASFLYTAGNNLKGLILTGLTVGIDISNQPMSATALDAFFTSLGTASGSQTITITGCIGAATCDTSIATNKGFTVVSS
jgi:hypothetical protein